MNASLQAVEPAHLHVPEYSRTFGPDVAEVAEMAGFPPDPEQRMVLDALFAVDARDKSAAFETSVVACRQNMKTGVFKQAVLGWLFYTDEKLVVWSAHEFLTAQSAFLDLDELIGGSDWLRKRVKHIYRGNGDEAIKLTSGSRLIFKTRTRGGGRGLSGSKVVLDEAFALQPMHMGALLPTLSAQPDPQVVYGSSAGLTDSEVLRGVRDRGRAGEEPRLAYFEWCAPPPSEACDSGESCSHALGAEGCGCDKPELWQRANPAMGRRITADYIAAERRALPPEEFGRERMGWWDDPTGGDSPIPQDQWKDLVDTESPRPEYPALALDVTPEQDMATIASAGRLADGSMHVDVLEHRSGAAWAVDRLAELAEQLSPCAVVLYPGGQAGAYIPTLCEGDFGLDAASGYWRLHLASKREYAQACGALVDDVHSGELRHRDRTELNDAVAGVRKKPIDDAFTWSRQDSTVDISPLVAVTLAMWGHMMHGSDAGEIDIFQSWSS